jgi:DNA-binding PadR family transcriptional regulator
MIGEQPRHGYELMKAIEARMAGSYTPSPGAIYPALAWLENLGFATPSVEEGSRKRYRITPQGEAFLSANKAAIDSLQARLSGADNGTREDPPEAVIRGMDNLKAALRFRLMRGKLDAGAVAVIVKALDTAALDIERNS